MLPTPLRPFVSVVALGLFASLVLNAQGAGLAPAMTPEGVQKKAVVIRNGAQLYALAQGDAGKAAPFMQVYFLLTGETGNRSPVTFTPNKNQPDGWLAKDSFIEWNTLQMVNFEAQSGRDLVRIFDNPGCAESFGRTGTAGASCRELGSEPQRSGPQKDNYLLLVPVLGRDHENYQGGFVRVSAGPVVKTVDDTEAKKSQSGSNQLGYDLVLVVDSTASMDTWFTPTTEALDSFIQSIRAAATGEIKAPLRVALLFYRDRKLASDCDIEYLFRWASELTEDTGAVSKLLLAATDAECGSDEAAESVYDALVRAVQDPKWGDGRLKVVMLIGDAAPHPASNKEKNPLGFTTDAVTQLASERNIRFLTVKIGAGDDSEFKALAEGAQASSQGRFRGIEANASTFRATLLGALQEEWRLLTAANKILGQGITQTQAAKDPAALQNAVPGLSSYDLPIIIANLPPGAASAGAPEFVSGWAPALIKKKRALSEFVFLSKSQLQIFANVMETIALAASEGATDGGEAFLRSLRSSLAQSLAMQPDELFRSGESLESMLEKAKILPFKTTVLSFTAEEVNAWKPAEFRRLNQILLERVTALKEFGQKPANQRQFGDKPHLYVPRDLFP